MTALSDQRPAYVYAITNLRNGKLYIGVSRDPAKRWRQHIWRAEKGVGTYLSRAMRKHGQMFFDFEVVHRCKSEDEALDCEVEYIRQLKPEYNLTDGGEGVVGFEWPEDRPHPRKGKTHSPATRAHLAQKTREYFAGRNVKQTPEHIARRVAKQIGRKLTDEHRRNLSESHKNSVRQIEAHYKPVTCVSDGKTYPHIQAAADAYGLSYQVIQKACYRESAGWVPQKRGHPRKTHLRFKFT